MLKTRVMPCLLLRNRSLVKTINFKSPNYVGDAINIVRIYNEKEVDEIIFLDINATTHGNQPPFELLSEIASECFMPFTYGGGICNIDQVKKLFKLGVEKVAINSHVYSDPKFITQIANTYGSQSVVVGIDVKRSWLKKPVLYSHCGTKKNNMNPIDHARNVEQLGAGEILLTAIHKDGTMDGYDLALIEEISNAVSIPVIACGGAGELVDFSKAVAAGASAVAAGSMVVYQGRNRAVLTRFPKRVELESVLP